MSVKLLSKSAAPLQLYCIQYTVYCILYTVYSILYTVYCIGPLGRFCLGLRAWECVGFVGPGFLLSDLSPPHTLQHPAHVQGPRHSHGRDSSCVCGASRRNPDILSQRIIMCGASRRNPDILSYSRGLYHVWSQPSQSVHSFIRESSSEIQPL